MIKTSKKVLIIVFSVFITVFLFSNFIISFGENIELPEYLYYATVSNHDLYMDTRKNVFIFENGEKKELVRHGTSYKYNLSELQDIVKKKVIDNEGNLYCEVYANSGDGLVKIDKGLNFENLHSNSYDLFNGVIYYSTYENDIGVIYKYENGQKIKIFEKKNDRIDLLKLTENSFIISCHENSIWKHLLYSDGVVSNYDITIEKYNDILYEHNQKKNNYVKLIYEEKIENYYGTELNKNYTLEDDDNKNSNKEIKYDEYLHIDDDGSISYYFNGEKVKNTIVFLEGNIKTNKGPMCLSDTYAYYFGFSGKAMKSGKISPYDKIRFQTDNAYRILKEYKNIYDLLLNKEKYEIYDNYYLMGKYEQDDISANGPEDIKWIVLEDDGENLLLLSNYIIDYAKIDSNFINDIFYNKSFTDDEKKKIISKEGKDKIFLISENILDKHNTNYKNKCKPREKSLISAIPTNHAIVKGIDVSLDDNEYYYHSSYLIFDDKIANADETIKMKNNSEEKFGFRPAMWIRKE